MSMMKTVLVVDDEAHIQELIKFNLEKNGFNVITADNGVDALKIAETQKPDLIFLDLMIPNMDGLDVCKSIRKNPSIESIPIIMITAKGEELDKILGLELGADDYITKPFSVRELVARAKAILRRSGFKQYEDIFRFGTVTINFREHEVTKGDSKIDLTLKEFELLEILIKNKGRVMTRDFLLEKIWGYEYVGETRTVDVHVRHLRKKVEDDDKNPIYIQTIRGIGYKFNYEEGYER